MSQGPTIKGAEQLRSMGAVNQLMSAADDPEQGTKAVQNALMLQQSGLASNPRLAQFLLTGQKPMVEVSPGASLVDALKAPGQVQMTAPAPAGSMQMGGLAGLLRTLFPTDAFENPTMPETVQKPVIDWMMQQINAALGTNAPAIRPPAAAPAGQTSQPLWRFK
jgi:hypothetical protein